ncbi:MAG: Anthranilate synthase component 1 [Elusimicrobia bacterium]|nr:Anthranilate synthase component 1 [Elusimicrobiota bacterium]
MNIHPTFDEFKRLAKKGNLIPVFSDMPADTVTPVSLLAAKWNTSRSCFLLESVEGGEKIGRYSIVSFDPEAMVQERNGETTFSSPGGKIFMRSHQSALEALARYMRCVKPVTVPGLPRFYGGAVGYMSYETVHNLERLPRTNPDVLGWPEATFFITGDLFVFDNTQQILKVITCVRLDGKSSLKKIYQAACNKVSANMSFIRSLAGKSMIIKNTSSHKNKKNREFVSNITRGQFMKAVEKAKEHIGKGDIIQVVLSRRQEKDTFVSPLNIYRALRVVNPSPYMYAIKLHARAIIGSSPEQLVGLENGVATTRPIAGTRRRGATPEQDDKLEKELLRDPKERAEHLMLVDLGRNDLGRVCRFGSVKVPKLMAVERYSHVMHIVSEVSGRVKPGKDGFDVLKAAFPAGTVAGAPKIRAMEIIDDLEKDQRGPYAGALGYFSYSGNMDMAITIRTILWHNGRVSIQTGAGLVADSDPAKEYMETENKAAGVKRAIELAESGTLFGGNK